MIDQLADVKTKVSIWKAQQRTYQNLAHNVKHIRKTLGMTQLELAKLMNTKQPDIARLERPSYGTISLNRLTKLAYHLKTTISELLEENN